MTDIAIRVENLGKRYKLGGQKSGDFRESFANWFRGKGRTSGSTPQASNPQEFWALQDVSFEIKQGEAVGIIGRNGAGKSTLLKILSRITEPTKGRFEIFGRVSSLLEVGTGFHEELTGRENVYLNGTILGMRRAEVKAKFDEIVDFSGVEKFIDTPVKHYSSGMKVRLAFAVAAHLEPEILIIDEVLAVGDSVFQAKCIDKMTKVAKSGRTILFVSHNMQAVKNLCGRGILISKGEVIQDSFVDDIINKYTFSSVLSGKSINLLEAVRSNNVESSIIFSKIVFNESPVKFGNDIKLSIKLKSISGSLFKDLDFGIAIKDKNYNILIHISNRFIQEYIDHCNDEDVYIFSISNNLKPGTYYLSLFLRCYDIIQDWLPDIVKLEIAEGNPYNFSDTAQITGSIFPSFNLKIQQKLLV